uniref:Uncharacterized protein n=1 Tax=Ditylenchus dipsaci TaxID=166011 RepID=A0A915DK56_9BILA
MTNTPTEIYSFTLGTLTANLMRNKTFSSWWASDAVKSERMIEMIFEKAINQMKTPGEPLEEITDEEIYKIYITKLSAYGYGKGVTDAMNFVIGGILKEEGIDVVKILGPEPTNEISKNDTDAIDDEEEGKQNQMKIDMLRKISTHVYSLVKNILHKFWLQITGKDKNIPEEKQLISQHANIS